MRDDQLHNDEEGGVMPRIYEEPTQLALDFETDANRFSPVKLVGCETPRSTNVIKISFGTRRESPAAIAEFDHASVVEHVLQAAKKLSW